MKRILEKVLLFYKNVETRIILTLFILLLVPTTIFLKYNFSYSEDLFNDKISGLVIQNLQLVANKIDNICADLVSISNMLGSDEIIASVFSNGNNNFDTDVPSFKSPELFSNDEIINNYKIENRIVKYRANIFYDYIVHTILLGKNGNICISLDDIVDDYMFKTNYLRALEDEEWNEVKKVKDKGIIWRAPYSYNMDGVDAKVRYISIVKAMNDRRSNDTFGAVIVNISEKSFSRIIGDSINGQMFLINEENQVIFNQGNDNISENMLYESIIPQLPKDTKGFLFFDNPDQRIMVNYYSIENMGWRLVSVIPNTSLDKDYRSLKIKVYLVNALLFLIFCIISVFTIFKILYPLKKLLDRIRQIRIGKYKVELSDNTVQKNFEDFNGIIRYFELMVTRIEELTNQVIYEQEKELELKYEALRAQINPHFLFNTLNSVKWMATASGAGNISRMVASLGSLLEVSMGKGNEMITLQEEIRLLEAYIYIQNVKYDNKLTLKVKIKENLKDLMVLKFILQPIVENSIMHGFKDENGICLIKVRAYGREDILEIVVLDNGAGISQEKLNQILASEDMEKGGHKLNNIGLKNVNDRIKLKFGEKYGITLKSKEKKYTRVSLKLPVIYYNKLESSE